ncbi:PQQ-binding-like beta-propeller repeat protein [Xylanimonas protaetiae]|uniref:Pyrrolo-quinoline quinone n=1 Tax=Xylanimonas protaetiae TaxID=2509457 RepID=A0A4P6F1R0_9MICO|nr:PQQ-binding-like beta-propeller repeat protein [Xylanimonas protaetiae]QAY69432.1 hypothetical protein ET471_04750 [Xylanimonas protaetiae]
MARRDLTEGLVFELVPDDDVLVPGAPSFAPEPGLPVLTVPVPGVPALPVQVAPAVLTRAARGASGWLRRRTPFQLVAGVAALVLFAGAGAGAQVLRERAAEARLQASAGGVADLSVPVSALWSRSFDAAARPPGQRATQVTPVGVLDAGRGPVVVLAVPPTGARPETVLHALDLDSGAERWEVPLGGYADCGVGAVSLSYERLALPRAQPRLVCTTGRGVRSRVVVVAPDGTTTTRAPDGVDARTSVLPGPGGVLLRVDHVGAEPDGVGVRQLFTGSQLTGGFTAPVHHVTAEDAVTGEVLWHVSVPGGWVSQGSGPDRCTSTGPDGSPRLDVAATSSRVVDDGMILRLCGVDLVVTAGGGVVATVPTGRKAASPGPIVQSLAGRGLGVVTGRSPSGWTVAGTRPTTVYDLAGRKVVGLRGGVLDPWATDGRGVLDLTGEPDARGRGVLVAHDSARLWAVSAAGTVRWEVPDQPPAQGAVASADGVVVLVRKPAEGGGELVALDERVGVALWRVPVAGFGFGAWSFLRGAWTDGRRLVVVTPGFYGPVAQPEWTAYDVRTGTVAWHLDAAAAQEVVAPESVCAAVVGRLLCFDDDRVVRVA